MTRVILLAVLLAILAITGTAMAAFTRNKTLERALVVLSILALLALLYYDIEAFRENLRLRDTNR